MHYKYYKYWGGFFSGIYNSIPRSVGSSLTADLWRLSRLADLQECGALFLVHVSFSGQAGPCWRWDNLTAQKETNLLNTASLQCLLKILILITIHPWFHEQLSELLHYNKNDWHIKLSILIIPKTKKSELNPLFLPNLSASSIMDINVCSTVYTNLGFTLCISLWLNTGT